MIPAASSSARHNQVRPRRGGDERASASAPGVRCRGLRAGLADREMQDVALSEYHGADGDPPASCVGAPAARARGGDPVDPGDGHGPALDAIDDVEVRRGLIPRRRVRAAAGGDGGASPARRPARREGVGGERVERRLGSGCVRSASDDRHDGEREQEKGSTSRNSQSWFHGKRGISEINLAARIVITLREA